MMASLIYWCSVFFIRSKWGTGWGRQIGLTVAEKITGSWRKKMSLNLVMLTMYSLLFTFKMYMAKSWSLTSFVSDLKPAFGGKIASERKNCKHVGGRVAKLISLRRTDLFGDYQVRSFTFDLYLGTSWTKSAAGAKYTKKINCNLSSLRAGCE